MKSILSLCLPIALSACAPANGPENTAAPAQLPVVAQKPAAAPDTPSTALEMPAQLLHYQCGDLLVSVRTQRDAAKVSFSGRDIVLPQVPTASGSSYGDGKGNAFWSKGNEARLTLSGKQQGACARSDRASPWVDAQSRGIAFRAVGNEPGWFVEVERGEAPALHALLDYGERRIDDGSVEPLTGDIAGFRGTATDGTAIELRITRTSCNDGMSGEAFEASAELLVADKAYKGCGAFL